MRWKNVLFTVVLNIFLMLVVTVIIEFNNMSERIQRAVDYVTIAFDTAIESSTAPEELFSRNNGLGTTGVTITSNSDNGEASTLVWDGSSWYNANSYYLAMYYWSHSNTFPTRAEYNSFAGGQDYFKVWTWLYGGSGYSMTEEWGIVSGRKGLGQSYTAYPTLCRNLTTQQTYNALPSYLNGSSSSSRAASKELIGFYNNIGQYLKTSNVPVKVPSGSSFDVVEQNISPLLRMGLCLDTLNTANGGVAVNDDLISSVKIGKRKVGDSLTQSVYMYSPYSLGVTYVPIEMLKPMFISHLDSRVRIGMGSSVGINNAVVDPTDFNQADGCIPTTIHVSSGGADVVKTHANDAGHRIINDGEVEYDLDTVQVCVDYFIVPLRSTSMYRTANSLYGALRGDIAHDGIASVNANHIMRNIGDLIKAHDTSSSLGSVTTAGYEQGRTVIARCSVRMKIHVTYESFILQFLLDRTRGASGSYHYDLKLYNPATNNYYADSDGVWLMYTKYYSYLR